MNSFNEVFALARMFLVDVEHTLYPQQSMFFEKLLTVKLGKIQH